MTEKPLWKTLEWKKKKHNYPSSWLTGIGKVWLTPFCHKPKGTRSGTGALLLRSLSLFQDLFPGTYCKLDLPGIKRPRHLYFISISPCCVLNPRPGHDLLRGSQSCCWAQARRLEYICRNPGVWYWNPVYNIGYRYPSQNMVLRDWIVVFSRLCFVH